MKKLLFVFLGLLLVSSVYAATTGSIGVIVLDKETEEPMGNVAVYIEELNRSGVSDGVGYVEFRGVPVGIYRVTAKHVGYGTITKTDVIVELGLVSFLAFELEEALIEVETIEVRAERKLIHPDEIGTTYRISHDQIVDMSSRDIFRAAQVMPGVICNEDGQFKARGGRFTNTNFMVDGLTMMDPFFNSFGAVINAKGIMGEVDVITGGMTAEYGNALGAVVNTVSREPEFKQYKGKLYFHTANIPDWFGDVERYRIYAENEYELDISGPIPFTDDKVAFAIATHDFLADAATWSGYKNRKYEDFHDYHLKLSYRVSPHHKVSYHHQYNYAYIRLRRNWNWTGTEDNVGWPMQKQYSRLHHLMYDWVVTPDSFLQLKLGYFASGINYGAIDYNNSTGEIDWTHLRDFDDLTGNDFYAYQNSNHHNFEFRTDFKTKFIVEENELKTGFDVQFWNSDLFWTVDYGIIWYGDPDIWPELAFVEDHEHNYYNSNFYIDDTYKLFEKLLLNAGLRYDYFGYHKVGQSAVSPTVGATYQIKENWMVRTNYWTRVNGAPIEGIWESDTGGLQEYLGDMDWGNEDIEPEKVMAYEVGTQYQFPNSNWAVELNAYQKKLDDIIIAFYVDPENWIAQYDNVGKGHVEGVELTLRKALTEHLEGWVNYTWMSAKGENFSANFWEDRDPNDPIFDKEYYLDYDQTHNINANIMLRYPSIFLNLILRYGSGYPYTPHDSFYDYGLDGIGPDSPYYPGPDEGEGNGEYDEGMNSSEGEKTYASEAEKVWNSERQPEYIRLDLHLKIKLKSIEWFDTDWWFIFKAFNMLDNANWRGSGGNEIGDINPYTGKPWIWATGATRRRIVIGLEARF